MVLQQKPHARFKRTRDDLAVVAKISLIEALTGNLLLSVRICNVCAKDVSGITVFIKHLDDRWVKVKSEPCLVYNTQSMLAVSGEVSGTFNELQVGAHRGTYYLLGYAKKRLPIAAWNAIRASRN